MQLWACKLHSPGWHWGPTVFQPNSNTDVHTVASLLKLYLRELPEPVIPYAKYEDFLSCAKMLSKEEETVSLHFEEYDELKG